MCSEFVVAVSTTSNLIQPMCHSVAMNTNALKIVYIRWYRLSTATHHILTDKCTQIWKIHIENWLSFVVVFTIAIDFFFFTIPCTSSAFGYSVHKTRCISFIFFFCSNDREREKERRNPILTERTNKRRRRNKIESILNNRTKNTLENLTLLRTYTILTIEWNRMKRNGLFIYWIDTACLRLITIGVSAIAFNQIEIRKICCCCYF